MQAEIGATAGVIWHTLNDKGELSLVHLKKQVKGKTPVFEWSVGWLAREDKIMITREKRSFRICLKELHPKTTNAL
jgi:Winged helix-turn-helix domain (DUF2582)